MTLKYNELQDLVLPKVSIDEFAPKTGNNDEVIVLGFYVKDKEPAKDLSHFLETGPYDILDVESSPASDEEGNYMVFVEVKRSKDFFDLAETVIKDLNNIMDLEGWKYKPYYSDDEFTAEDSSWKNFVITDPDKYVSREEFKENKMKEEKNEYNNNIGNFFLESLITNVTLDESEEHTMVTINNGRKSFNYQLVNFGEQGIMEDISKEPILDRSTEDIFLERCLGKDYTVNNFSDQRFTITKENSDKILLLKKL